MPTLPQLRLEGKEHFEAGRLDDAIRCFLDAIDLFTEERSTTPEAVEEFVKAAGNLCVCYHSKRAYDTCFRAAREALGIYPVIPKAYGAMGMCMMDRLAEQQAAAAASLEHASGTEGTAADAGGQGSCAARAALNEGERLRRDPLRYVAKLDGILCTVDEAHEYLCRAVMLSEGSLQASLGPYIESAVKHINEQFISACHALEREHGDALLDHLCPPEDSLAGAPMCLSTAPPAVRDTVMSIDPVDRAGPVPVPRHEAATILADAAAKQQEQRQQQGEGEAQGEERVVPDHPVDFALSGKSTTVRVCHVERGGLPRGLTLLRATRPFAVAAWLTPSSAHPAATDGGGATPAAHGGPVEVLDERGVAVTVHSDPVNMMAEPTPEMVAQHLDAAFGGARAGRGGNVQMGPVDPHAPKAMYCSHCAKEVTMQSLLSGVASGCATCGGVVYCSSECQGAYEERHNRYECRLRAKLQEMVAAAAVRQQRGKASAESVPPAATASSAQEENIHDNEAPIPPNWGEEVPGSSWTKQHLLHCVLPLSIAVYGGLCAQAANHEMVRAQLEKGVPRWRTASLPPAVLTAIHELAALMEVNPMAAAGSRGGSGGAESLLAAIVLMVRLHQCPPPTHSADEEDRSEHPFSFFYSERLLFRHSCEANCRWVSAMRTVVTSRFICKGEELTIAVETNEGSDSSSSSDGSATTTAAELFPQHWPWQIRRKWLLRHHGFDCGCARCQREGNLLNPARGDLSSDITEQLLSGDRLRRPKTASHDVTVTHPTHHFHPRLHQTIREARVMASAGKEGDVKRALRLLQDAAKGAEPFLLPTHYLLEDLRTAVARTVAMHPFGAEELSLSRSVCGLSLLFYESMWAGAVPAKVVVMGRLPAPPEVAYRRRNYLRQTRHAHATAASENGGGSISNAMAVVEGTSLASVPAAAATAAAVGLEDSPERKQLQQQQEQQQQQQQRAIAGGRAGTTNRRRRLPPRPERDFTEGTIADHFYGSYQSWYS